MKRVCENWKEHFPEGKVSQEYFAEFETRAKNVGTEMFHVKTVTEGREIIAKIAEELNAKKVVAIPSAYVDASGALEQLKKQNIEVYTEAADIAEHVETADIGISTVEFGIAETGSVCYDGYSYESRVVSMLPPLHVVFLPASYVVAGIREGFEILSNVFHEGFTGFITGPSRTSDIERVLTIGVHGPSRFVIIAVDELPGGVN
ncbi:Lactate utilization protein C [bioreactor metagenome]|uniref:Lactate utilization protein C n=1 Tax=bioreactor metagenome TaxID=1076179 RepID=A0A644T1V0_9ZZZZ|nr:LUD domain-containing protein [Negativicutes bacterium]